MIERLNIIEQRYNELNELLSSEEVLSNYTEMRKLNKEKAGIEETVQKYHEYQRTIDDIAGLKEMINDPEMKEMAELELPEAEERKVQIEHELEILLIPKDENDGKNIIMEIRGAAGGDEANIFAGDLYRMYTHYAESQGWKTEVINESPGEAGGFAQI